MNPKTATEVVTAEILRKAETATEAVTAEILRKAETATAAVTVEIPRKAETKTEAVVASKRRLIRTNRAIPINPLIQTKGDQEMITLRIVKMMEKREAIWKK